MPTQERRRVEIGGPLLLPGDSRWDPAAAFGRRAPLIVDLGAARARYFLSVAPEMTYADFVGIEVRKIRVEAALERLAKHGLTNCRMAWGEVTRVVATCLPEGSVTAFTILFPDPWPKKRHAKRRTYQLPETVALLASRLSPEGLVLVKSDSRSYFGAIDEALVGSGRFLATDDSWARPPGLEPFDLDRPEETFYERKWLDEGRSLQKAFYRLAE